MFVWVKKETINMREMELMFEPPDIDDEEDWLMLTSRESHYTSISKELDKAAQSYIKENDFRAAKVAKDLAAELRRQVSKNIFVN